MENRTQIRLKNHILPSLGKLLPGEKNLLSPLQLSFEQKATADEIQATGLVDSEMEMKSEFKPVLQVLANPTSLVDLRISAGGQFQQFSLYYGDAGESPILLMNTFEDLLLEHPANTKGILDGLMNFSSDSLIASFDFQVALPNRQALVLAALIDLHRRTVARAFANLAKFNTQSVHAEEIADWIVNCPDDPQWITALIRQPDDHATTAAQLQADLNLLVRQGMCKASEQGYELSEPTSQVGNRLVLLDSFYTLDVARISSGGKVAVVSITALQAGVNDLLQIEFQGGEIQFVSLSPMAFLEQVAYYQEKGGAEFPDLPGDTETQEPPVDAVTSNKVLRLAVPGLATPFLLTEALTIGRAEGCELKLADQQVSRQHTRIERRQDEFWIIDLGSSNGTFVNDSRITETIRLEPGDKIQIGDTTLEVLAESSSAPEDATFINLQAPIIQPQMQALPVADKQTKPVNSCQFCGQPLSATARFCTQCGTPVKP